MNEPVNNENHQNNGKRKKLLIFATIGFVFIGVLVFLYWLTILRYEEYTNDAYVNGNMVELTPQVPGIVTSINADNTDFVQKDQVIIELDKTDYLLALEKSQANLAETVRDVVQMFINVEQLAADLEVKKAALMRAEIDYQNRVNLVGIGGVSKEEFEHVETDLIGAKAGVSEAVFALESAIAQVQNTTVRTHPLVKQATQEVKDAWVNLKRCEIVSPVDGYVAMRTVQLGEWVTQAEPLLMIIPLNELWVDANFKEVKLSDMRIGQPARIKSDIYGHSVTFHGKVIGINPGTGSVFSALPPQNATGNWIKIVQRVPVRISLDPEQLRKNPLWLGLSMDVTVDIHDTKGPMLSEARRAKPIYKTDIYKKQEEGVDPIIEKIIQENADERRAS